MSYSDRPRPRESNGDDAALGPVIGKRWRQRIEVSGGTRKSRQADDRNSRRSPGAVFPYVQTQSVLRADECASRLIAGTGVDARFKRHGRHMLLLDKLSRRHRCWLRRHVVRFGLQTDPVNAPVMSQ
jgi:hypothetical protein